MVCGVETNFGQSLEVLFVILPRRFAVLIKCYWCLLVLKCLFIRSHFFNNEFGERKKFHCFIKASEIFRHKFPLNSSRYSEKAETFQSTRMTRKTFSLFLKLTPLDCVTSKLSEILLKFSSNRLSMSLHIVLLFPDTCWSFYNNFQLFRPGAHTSLFELRIVVYDSVVHVGNGKHFPSVFPTDEHMFHLCLPRDANCSQS